MSLRPAAAVVVLAAALSAAPGYAQSAAPPAEPPAFDAELARRVGADQRGMRNYVLVILKSGPNKVPAGPERDAMFKGHFANMERLAGESKLALAGPFGTNDDGWRGLFVFAVDDIEAAKALVATDPVVAKGEMIAEYHKWYGSAALMLVPDAHKKVTRPTK
jgi:uncharacterized protein YciI